MCRPNFQVFLLLILYSVIYKSVTEEIYLTEEQTFDDGSYLDSPFVSKFLKLFSQTEIIYTAFDKVIETSKEEQVFSKVMEDWASSLKLPEPSTTAKSLLEATTLISDAFTPFSFAKVIAKTYENFFRDYGVLTESNANDISENFFKYLEKASLQVEPQADAYKYLKALMEGASKFLDSRNVITPDAIQVLVIYFYKEMLDLKLKGEYI